MTTEWKSRRLGDVCEIIKGRKPSLRETKQEGDLPYLVARYMRGIADPEYASVSDRNSVVVEEKDTIIICDGSNSGEVFSGFRGILSSTMGKLSLRIDINQRYLRYFLFSTFDLFNGSKTGAAIPHLDKEAFYALDIPLPPLEEQERIVAILDEAFEGISTAKANAERNLKNAEELFSSYRDSVLSGEGLEWQHQKLSDLCEVKHGFAFKSEHFAQTGEYVLLTPGNFYESGGYRDRGEKQKYYTGEIPPGFILSEGDLLVAMTEQAAGLLGSPIIVPESGLFLHNQRLGLVKPKAGVPWLNSFFFHVFNLTSFRREVHASATGVKVRHTSPSKIGEIEVAFPSDFSVQKQIVSRLDLLSDEAARLGAVCQRKLTALDGLKKSLLHHAFSGQL